MRYLVNWDSSPNSYIVPRNNSIPNLACGTKAYFNYMRPNQKLGAPKFSHPFAALINAMSFCSFLWNEHCHTNWMSLQIFLLLPGHMQRHPLDARQVSGHDFTCGYSGTYRVCGSPHCHPLAHSGCLLSQAMQGLKGGGSLLLCLCRWFYLKMRTEPPMSPCRGGLWGS